MVFPFSSPVVDIVEERSWWRLKVVFFVTHYSHYNKRLGDQTVFLQYNRKQSADVRLSLAALENLRRCKSVMRSINKCFLSLGEGCSLFIHPFWQMTLRFDLVIISKAFYTDCITRLVPSRTCAPVVCSLCTHTSLLWIDTSFSFIHSRDPGSPSLECDGKSIKVDLT